MFKQRLIGGEVSAIQITGGRAFQVEKIANAKVQRWENPWFIRGPAKRSVW